MYWCLEHIDSRHVGLVSEDSVKCGNVGNRALNLPVEIWRRRDKLGNFQSQERSLGYDGLQVLYMKKSPRLGLDLE